MEGNSAAVALERFGRAPASGETASRDADALSAATAVQRLKHDKSAGTASGRGNAAVRAALVPRPTRPQVPPGKSLLLPCQGLLCVRLSSGLSLLPEVFTTQEFNGKN